jgi:hypothetical protein
VGVRRQRVHPQRWRASWRVVRMPFLITALALHSGQRGMARFMRDWMVIVMAIGACFSRTR